MNLEVFAAVSGIGLVLFGLRVFTNALDEGIVERIRPACEAVGKTPARSFVSGIAASAGLQASSMTVIAAMGLLERSLLPLDRAILLMLGATIGTSLKIWVFANPFAVLGPLLVAVPSLLLLGVRAPARRRLLEALFAAGMLYLGWSIVQSNLQPLLEAGSLFGSVTNARVDTLWQLMATVGIGFVLAAVVQSSSTVVYLTLGLAVSGGLPFGPAAAIVLGANVGTAVTPLIASIEYRREVRSLALAHLLVKAVGVAIVGLFFHTFLSFVAAITEPLGATAVWARIAAVHTVFNVLNALIWAPLAGPLAHLFLRTRGEAPRERGLLTAPVRRLLLGVPGEAIQRIEADRDEVMRGLKVRTDRMFRVLVGDDDSDDLVFQRDLRTRVLVGQELLGAIAARREVWNERMQALMRELNLLEDILESVAALSKRLQVERARYRLIRVTRLSKGYAEVRTDLEALWGAALDPSRVADVDLASFARHEMALHERLRDGRVSDSDVIELAKEVAHLQRLFSRVHELAATRRTVLAVPVVPPSQVNG